MIQAAFLVSLFAAICFLVAAVVIARVHWRPDIEPYGRQTNVLHLMRNLPLYVMPGAVARVRRLEIVGVLFLICAVGALAYKLTADLAAIWGRSR